MDQTMQPQRQNRKQSISPLFIRSFKSVPVDKEFTVFGRSVYLISICGVLKSYKTASTRINYVISDLTGEIGGIQWLDSNTNIDVLVGGLKEQTMVLVYGTIKTKGNSRYMTVVKIRPVTNYNEVITHRLNCVLLKAQFEYRYIHKDEKASVSNFEGKELASSMVSLGMMGNSDISVNMMKDDKEMPKLSKQVLEIIKSNKADGYNYDYIKTKIAPNLHDQLQNACAFLVNEGHTYTTVHENHFMATDTGN